MSYERFCDDYFIEGIAYALTASKEGCTGGCYNYNAGITGDSFLRRKEMRAYRTSLTSRNKTPRELEEDTLQDDLIVLFGPDMSPRDAITSLELVIKKIEEHGLLIGRDAKNNDVVEEVTGKTKRV